MVCGERKGCVGFVGAGAGVVVRDGSRISSWCARRGVRGEVARGRRCQVQMRKGPARRTPTEKLVDTFRSYLLGRFTKREREDKFEVEEFDDFGGPSSGDSSVEVEDARNGVRFKQPYYAADGSGATVAKSAEELEWEKRYKWLFIEDEQRSVLSRSPENIKDNAEKVTLGIVAFIVLGFVLRALIAFGQFMFNFTFSFFAIFLLSAGIFALFALSRF